MAEKQIKCSIAHKNATEAEWNDYGTIVPKAGEMVLFDADANHATCRIKIGDGAAPLSILPFAVNDSASKGIDTSINALSTDDKLPTSKAVKDYLNRMISRKATKLNIDIVIDTTDWSFDQDSDKYKTTIDCEDITSDMVNIETYVDGDIVEHSVDIITYNGKVELYIEEQPTVIWDQFHMILMS